MIDPIGSDYQRTAVDAGLFAGIVASAMDAIIAVDSQFHVIAFNPAAEAMFGVDAGEVLGQSLNRFIPQRFHASHRKHVERFGRTGEAQRRMGALGAVTAVRANGEEFLCEASVSQSDMGGQRVASVILREIVQPTANPEATALARELDHRAKNILSIVSSLISLTSAPSREDYVMTLAGRIAALSRANALLSIERWRGALLAGLIQGELEAQAGGRTFTVAGPDIRLTSRSVQPLGLLFHELSSNAARHGALSAPDGRVSVRWLDEPDGGLAFVWREEGGPAATEPTRPGLGLRLVHQIIDYQLCGSCTINWEPEGLVVKARLPNSIFEPTPTERSRPPAHEIAAPRRDDISAPQAKDAERDPRGTLLIVEDEPILAIQLSRALGEFGWTVTGVASSLDAANRLLSESPRPDAAILDVDLGGVPVFPFARALRHAGIPFLFCTGYEDVAYNREFADCTVVRKPATVLQIVAALRKTVHDRNFAATG